MMKLLHEIKDKELPPDESKLKIREASRAILFDDNDLIPILFVSKYNCHKIPGGGVKNGEDKSKALIREILEEVGSEIEITNEIGKIIEFRSKWNWKQTSYCYTGKIKSKNPPTFTEEELNQNFKLIWLTLDEAISKVKNDQPTNYAGLFIQKRDLVFLKKVAKMKKEHKLGI